MGEVFTVEAAEGVPETEPGPPMQLWWGRVRGELLGLLTDQHGAVPVGADPVVLGHLARTGAVIKCMGQEGVASIAGINPRQNLGFLSGELEPLRWERHTTIRVDGSPVQAVTLSHRGLEFAAGDDFLAYPFVLVRLQGGSTPWPALRTVRAPGYTP